MSSPAIYLPDVADIRCADRVKLAEYVRELTKFINQCEARIGVAIAKAEADGIKAVHQCTNSTTLLEELAQISRAAAGRIVARAHATNPSRGLDGTVIPALAPLAGVAALEGAISPAHVDEITKIMVQIPATVSEEVRGGAEKILVDLAREVKPLEVSKAGERLLATLDPDGPEPKDPPERPKRELSFHERPDGSASFKGVLDKISLAQVKATLAPLSGLHSSEEGPDTRSLGERQADALMDVFHLAMGAEHLPKHGGDRVHVAITVDYETLKSGIGTAMLDYGGTITASEARLLACDCRVIPVVMGGKSEPMDLGRSRRTITIGQRRRLVLRDGNGCSFPGCRTHAKSCDGHHVIYWILGGPTDIGNLTLLCARHHRLIHCGGWEVRMAPDGKPDFIPPDYLDPLRRPRRNTVHL
jgi:Domain of unknown function (DUF222)